jgi:hypothetical protein
MRLAMFAATLFAGAAPAAVAAPLSDPLGDYTAIAVAAARQPDLDVLLVDALRQTSSFFITSTQAGAVGTTTGGIYVWGVDRGTGVAGFGALAPGVLFDTVVVLNPAGGSFVRLIPEALTIPLTGPLQIAGNSIGATVPFASLPSRGFALDQYGWNLWPRLAGGPTSNIADFAPDNSTFVARASAPGAAALFGFGLAALAARRRAQR